MGQKGAQEGCVIWRACLTEDFPPQRDNQLLAQVVTEHHPTEIGPQVLYPVDNVDCRGPKCSADM